MNSGRDAERNDAALRYALRRAAIEQRKIFRQLETRPDGLVIPTTTWTMPSPEHYHLVYHVPKTGTSTPDFARIYIDSKDAYRQIWEYAQQAEPNVEYGDDGQIGMEMRLHGRADLWWVVLEVAACIRSACEQNVSREHRKRQLILLPDQV